MAFPTLTPPNQSMSEDEYNTTADAWAGNLPAWAAEATSLAASMSALAAGSAYGLPYKFSTTTTVADPTAGYIRLNNATQNTATTLAISNTDSQSQSRSATLETLDDSTSLVKGHIAIVKQGDGTKWLLCAVTAITSPTGYHTVTLSVVDSSAASPFANDDAVLIKFTRTGDKGDTGSYGLTYTARSSNTQLTAANFASPTRILIDATGTWTQTIAAVAGIAAGDYVEFRNSGTGVITIDPNSSEQIDGATTVKVYPGESCKIVSTGSAFYTTGLAPKGTWITLSTQSPASVASVDFQNLLTSDYDEWELAGVKIKASGSATLYLRTSTDGGVTYDATASNYDWTTISLASAGTVTATSASGGGGNARIELMPNAISTTAGSQFSFLAKFSKPTDADYLMFGWEGNGINSSGAVFRVSGTGARLAAADVDSLRVLTSANNIASGTLTLRARKK